MTTLSDSQQIQREGWAIGLVDRAFPNLRTQHPVRFDTNVRLIYEFSLAHPHADRTDPLDLRPHGTFSTPHAAEIASTKWLHRPKQAGLFQALEAGNTDEAASLLGVTYATGPKLPAPLHKGQLTTTDRPSVLSDLGSTAKQFPGAAVHDVGKVAKGAGHAAKDVAKGAGNVFGGIGSFLTNPVAIIVIVLVIVMVIKK